MALPKLHEPRAIGRGLGIFTPMRSRPRRAFGSDSRATPAEELAALDREFGFTLDPCPFDNTATAGAPLWDKCGLAKPWSGERVFCNPPYSDIAPWLSKWREAEVAVYLLPVKTDLGWWHDRVMAEADEIRLYRGRLRFVGMSGGAPFPSAIVVFQRGGPPRWTSIERQPRQPIQHDTEANMTRNGREPRTDASAEPWVRK